MHLALPKLSPRRLVGLAAASFAVLVLGLQAMAIWSDYEAAIARARSTTQALARMLEEHAKWTFQASDLVVKEAQEFNESLSGRRPTEEDWRHLHDIAGNLPHFGHLMLLGPDGRAQIQTSHFPSIGISYADRDYFQAHRDGAAGVYFGGLIKGRASGKYGFSVSRAIHAADGSFKGAAVAFIHTDYFHSVYKDIELGPGSAIAIYRNDGALLAREPMPETPDRKSLQASPLLERAGSGEAGVYEGVSAIDGVERITAYRRVQGLPLFVTTGIARSTALAEWRGRLYKHLTISGVALLILLALARATCRSLTREDSIRRQLAEALGQKEMLLSEVHHRVKNNLQIISSLLQLEATHNAAAPADGLAASMNRIQAMALVHELLYQTGEFGGVELDLYLERLCKALIGGAHKLELALDPVLLDLDRAVPLAMMVNEIVCNALKHAFPADHCGKITISLHKDQGRLNLAIRDNGVGLPDDFDPSRSNSLGMTLILGLSRQLGADFQFENDDGTRCTLNMAA